MKKLIVASLTALVLGNLGLPVKAANNPQGQNKLAQEVEIRGREAEGEIENEIEDRIEDENEIEIEDANHNRRGPGGNILARREDRGQAENEVEQEIETIG